MQIKLINVPLTDDGTQQAELNRFLAGHKVLEVEQKFFQNEKGGCWSFCIRYIESAASSQASQFTGKEKIDYKQVLNEQKFAIFSKLRECRKAIAAEDAVPGKRLYTHSEIDHERLFDLTARLKGRFMLTYDNTADIRQLAETYNLPYRTIPMKTTHHLEKTEIIISDNFVWWK